MKKLEIHPIVFMLYTVFFCTVGFFLHLFIPGPVQDPEPEALYWLVDKSQRAKWVELRKTQYLLSAYDTHSVQWIPSSKTAVLWVKMQDSRPNHLNFYSQTVIYCEEKMYSDMARTSGIDEKTRNQFGFDERPLGIYPTSIIRAEITKNSIEELVFDRVCQTNNS